MSRRICHHQSLDSRHFYVCFVTDSEAPVYFNVSSIYIIFSAFENFLEVYRYQLWFNDLLEQKIKFLADGFPRGTLDAQFRNSSQNPLIPSIRTRRSVLKDSVRPCLSKFNFDLKSLTLESSTLSDNACWSVLSVPSLIENSKNPSVARKG